MNLSKLIVAARKIHRFFVLIIVSLTGIMVLTGMKMKYPLILPFYDALAARRLHNTASTLFAVAIIVMSATGLLLYLYPHLQKWFRPKPVAKPE